MPVKKKVETTKNTDNTENDKKSVSTESDVESGTFSQYDEEEAKEEDNEDELVSDSENVEDEIVDAEDELEEGEGEEEQVADTEEVKPKKKKGPKKTVLINNDCLYNNIDFEEDYDEKDELIPDNKRITINRLTKYERVRIIGIRAKQIMTGANILLRGIENKTPSEIAELELKHNMVPFKIKRRLPNGRYEVWKLSELEK
jgi:DNA-directed RNA polymerase I, II, and III subunit RPABC2